MTGRGYWSVTTSASCTQWLKLPATTASDRRPAIILSYLINVLIKIPPLSLPGVGGDEFRIGGPSPPLYPNNIRLPQAANIPKYSRRIMGILVLCRAAITTSRSGDPADYIMRTRFWLAVGLHWMVTDNGDNWLGITPGLW